MRLILFTVFLIVSLIGSKKCNAQTGTFIWTNGAPTTNPGASGARFAVDRATFRWYEWVSGTTWIGSGDRIQQISGCSAPNYTPGIHNSRIVINSCDTLPGLYAWDGTTWMLLNSGAGVGGAKEVTGVNTIAELSALTTARSEEMAFVRDSLRGGTFVLKSASGNTVDNGIVFSSAIDGRVWVRQYDGKYNALWYGVNPDGVTDNTALYATIFASMPRSSVLYFPSGTYKGDIVLNGGATIEGNGLSTVLVSTTTGNAITLTNHPNELGKMVISDFKILGYNGIVFTSPNANKWQFRDIDIEVSNIGVKKEQGNIYNTFENLTILGGQYGLYAVNSPIQTMHTGGDLWLKCRFVNSAKAGIYINDRSFGSGQLKFLNCFFEGNLGFAVFVKQFGAGRVVSAPSLKFVDCWNEANFILPNVTIDGITYDSLNTVRVSKAVAVFDGSPCSLDARDSSFVTFINTKTDGIENYIRTDITSFVQYKDCGLSRTNEGNVIFDGLTAFETGNQNSAQVPNRKLKVNHPKTVKTIDFSNTLPIVPGSSVSGGILFDKCQRYTLTGGTSILNLIPITSGKIGVWTIDVRNKSTATNFQLVSTLSLGTVAMAYDTLWHTYAGIQINTATGNAGINLPIGTGTIDLSAFQYLEFDDIKEAIEYWNSGSYATGKPVEVSGGTGTGDYVTKFTSSNTIGDSQIRDNGTAVGIGIAPNNTFKLGVNGQLFQNATNPYSLTQNGGNNFFVSGSSANITGGGANDYDAFLYGSNNFNIFTNSARRLIVKGDGSIGFNIASPQPLSIQLQGLNSTSLPATTGTTQNGLITRFSSNSTSAILDLGSDGGGGFWLQSTDNSALNASYPILINKNGGNVGINKSSPASSLDVNGVITSAGTQTNGNENVTGSSTIQGASTALEFVTDQSGSHAYYKSKRSGVLDFEISNVNGSYWHYNGTAYSFFIQKNTGNVGINTGTNATEPLEVNGNIKTSGSIIVGRWTTATRPTPAANTNPIGFNTTTGKHEGWDGATWNSFY
jgi:hypothetical protein